MKPPAPISILLCSILLGALAWTGGAAASPVTVQYQISSIGVPLPTPGSASVLFPNGSGAGPATLVSFRLTGPRSILSYPLYAYTGSVDLSFAGSQGSGFLGPAKTATAAVSRDLGTYYVRIIGFDATSLGALQGSFIDGAALRYFSFSGQEIARTVPEPGSLGLVVPVLALCALCGALYTRRSPVGPRA